jgi:PadR family transcriptional regulator, regulatory protein PadR
MHHHRHRRVHRGPRTRWLSGAGDWAVRARVERFVEPAVLLLLAERPRHGYELIDELPELVGEERVDVGNLYRFLRALEEDGIVESQWRGDLPGPARRTYSLTDTGRRLLRKWADALRQTQEEIAQFLERHDEERR